MIEALGTQGPALAGPGRPPPALLLPEVLERFEVYLRDERRLSIHTVRGYQDDVRLCLVHIAGELGRAPSIEELTRERLQSFLASLAGRSERTVKRRASGIRALFKFASCVLETCADAARALTVPRLPPAKLPRILNEEEAARLVEAPLQLSGRAEPTLRDLRDAAILELLYAGGLRASEAAGLELDHVILRPDYAVLYVLGKGKRERLVAVKGLALEALRRYLRRRAEAPGAAEQRAVFLGWWGAPLTRKGVHKIVRQWAAVAGVRAWPHLLRHCCASHLLARGAELRQVQEFLGHADPAMTAHYAQVSEGQLIEVAGRHPRSRIQLAAPVPEPETAPSAVGLVQRMVRVTESAGELVRYAVRLFWRSLLDPAPAPS